MAFEERLKRFCHRLPPCGMPAKAAFEIRKSPFRGEEIASDVS
jgi:hypothetical protein